MSASTSSVTVTPIPAPVKRLAERCAAHHPQLATRAWRAAALVAEHCLTYHHHENLYTVGYYTVDLEAPSCTCPDFTKGQAPELRPGRRYCKHMIAAQMLERLAEDEDYNSGAVPQPAPMDEPEHPPVRQQWAISPGHASMAIQQAAASFHARGR